MVTSKGNDKMKDKTKKSSKKKLRDLEQNLSNLSLEDFADA